MQTEYEVKVLEVNYEEMVLKLEKLGAIKTMDVLQERYVYDVIPYDEHKWIRLRTNGQDSTLTIKDLKGKSIDGMKEIEIGVSDFLNTHALLENLGYKSKGFQQNKRIQYILNGVEIDFDRWPLIPMYMEIEGKSEDEVKSMLEVLGIDESMVVTLDVDSIYRHYGIENIGDLNFEMEDK